MDSAHSIQRFVPSKITGVSIRRPNLCISLSLRPEWILRQVDSHSYQFPHAVRL